MPGPHPGRGGGKGKGKKGRSSVIAAVGTGKLVANTTIPMKGPVNPNTTPLSWSTIPNFTFTLGEAGSYDVRQYLNGSNKNLANLTINKALPIGVTFEGDAFVYDGTGVVDNVAGIIVTATTPSESADSNAIEVFISDVVEVFILLAKRDKFIDWGEIFNFTRYFTSSGSIRTFK